MRSRCVVCGTIVGFLLGGGVSYSQPPPQPEPPAHVDFARGAAWVALGETNEENGLRLVETAPSGASKFEVAGGRPCRRTDRASRIYFLYFNVDDAYVNGGVNCLTVTIEYYDTGKEFIRLEYDSADEHARDNGVFKSAGFVRKTNTNTWKTHSWYLSDARFANRIEDVGDFRLTGDGWRREGEDILIGRVTVTKAAVAMTATTEVVAVGGKAEIEATVRDLRGEPVPDGAAVTFSVDRGVVTPKAETSKGKAKAGFTATAVGTASVVARSGEAFGVLRIVALPGTGEAAMGDKVFCTFQDAAAFKLDGPAAQSCQVAVEADPVSGQGKCTRLTYDFRENREVLLRFAMPVSVKAERLRLSVLGDNNGNFLRARLTDNRNETHQYIVTKGRFREWQTLEISLADPEDHWGGDDNGVLDYPVSLDCLLLCLTSQDPVGAIFLRDLSLAGKAPESVFAIRLRAKPATKDLLVEVRNQSEVTQKLSVAFECTDAQHNVVLKGSLGKEGTQLKAGEVVSSRLLSNP